MIPKIPEVEVYVKELSKLGYGYPLYDPNPARSCAISIGDVGYVSELGAFHRLFNVFCPEGDPINNRGVPNGFVPMDVRFRRARLSHPVPAGFISSSSVCKQGGELLLDGGIPDTVLSCQCEDQQWAALILKRDAIREDSEGELAFKLKIDISIEDLELVTGHDMTNEWATATSVDQSVGEFNSGDNSSPLGGVLSAPAWGSWTSSASLRFGPSPGDDTTPPLDPSDGHPAESDRLPSNQCIFIRGFRVSRQQGVFPGKIKAAAEPTDDGQDPDEENSSHDVVVVRLGIDSDVDSNVDTGECDSQAFQCDIYKAAQDYIFMNSDADVALLHDNDVFRFNQGTYSEGHGDTLIDVKVVDGVKVGKLGFNNDQTSVEREHVNAGNITSADDDARGGRRDDKPSNADLPPVDIFVIPSATTTMPDYGDTDSLATTARPSDPLCNARPCDACSTPGKLCIKLPGNENLCVRCEELGLHECV